MNDVNIWQDCVGWGTTRLSYGETVDLREFFRAEEDERLGRWRWPEDPDYVVYAAPREGAAEVDFDAFVVNERIGASAEYVRAEDNGNSIIVASDLARAARAYFAAHPESKPWDSAEDGDVWVLAGAGGLEQPWRRIDGKWMSFTKSGHIYDAVAAIAGRRIWPEPSDG